MSLPSHAKSTYRALLRELPRRTLSHPSTPLHNRLRTHYRAETQSPKSQDAEDARNELSHRVQEAEQLALYARAQRQYAALVERYNPGSWLDEQERIRLTARRVGWDLPVEAKKE